jgi:hypothetical protein
MNTGGFQSCPEDNWALESVVLVVAAALLKGSPRSPGEKAHADVLLLFPAFISRESRK